MLVQRNCEYWRNALDFDFINKVVSHCWKLDKIHQIHVRSRAEFRFLRIKLAKTSPLNTYPTSIVWIFVTSVKCVRLTINKWESNSSEDFYWWEWGTLFKVLAWRKIDRRALCILSKTLSLKFWKFALFDTFMSFFLLKASSLFRINQAGHKFKIAFRNINFKTWKRERSILWIFRP